MRGALRANTAPRKDGMYDAPFRTESAPPSAVSRAPQPGREPAAALLAAGSRAAVVRSETEASRTIVRALWEAVRNPALPTSVSDGNGGGAPRSAAAPAGAAAEVLAAVLLPYLEARYFFVCGITPHGFIVRQRRISDETAELATRLASEGLVQLLFKRGLDRAEIGRFIAVLRTETARTGHSVATLLWEVPLPHVVCRCADERAGAPDDPRHDLREWDDTCPEAEEPFEIAHITAAPPRLGAVDAEAAPAAEWRAGVVLTAQDRARLRGLKLEDAGAAAVRLARRLAVLHGVASDPARRQASLEVLGDLVHALFEQREFVVLQSVLETLQQARGGEFAVPETALEHVVQRLCSEPHVLALGAALEERGTWPAETVAVRNFLAALPNALDPLCRLLLRQEDMQARQLTCRVLAAVAKDDPGALAARAAGQPWYLARNIAYVLGRIGNARTVPILKRWVKHEDEQVRVEVARALGRVRDPGGGLLLADMLDDPAWHVRQTAVWALASRADTQVLPRLRHILFEDRTFRTRRPEERDDFFRTYGRLADRGASEELMHLLEQRQLVSVGWQAELRRGAALALGETERPEAARLLRAHQRERDPRLREAVAEALRNLRARITATFDDPEEWTRPAASAVRPAGEAAFKLDFAVEK